MVLWCSVLSTRCRGGAHPSRLQSPHHWGRGGCGCHLTALAKGRAGCDENKEGYFLQRIVIITTMSYFTVRKETSSIFYFGMVTIHTQTHINTMSAHNIHSAFVHAQLHTTHQTYIHPPPHTHLLLQLTLCPNPVEMPAGFSLACFRSGEPDCEEAIVE